MRKNHIKYKKVLEISRSLCYTIKKNFSGQKRYVFRKSRIQYGGFRIMKKAIALILSAVLCIGLLPVVSLAAPEDYFNITEKVIEIEGLTKAYKFLQISDTHTLAMDKDDPLFVRGLAQYDYHTAREAEFNQGGVLAEDRLRAMFEWGNSSDIDGYFLTGDIIDVPTAKNIELLQDLFTDAAAAEKKVFYTFGNHDWTTHLKDFNSTEALTEWRPLFDNVIFDRDGLSTYSDPTKRHIRYMDYGEFIVCTVDDSNNNFSLGTPNALNKIMTKLNKPTVLLTHIPFENEALLESNILTDRWGSSWNRITFGPNTMYPGNEGPGKNNPEIKSMYELVTRTDTNLKTIVAGHIHAQHEGAMSSTVTQYIAGAGYKGDITLYTLKPAPCKEHTWEEASCTAPKTCSVCGATEGEPAPHTGGTATCTEQAICEMCQSPYGEIDPDNHNYVDYICTRCGAADPNKPGRTFIYGDLDGNGEVSAKDSVILKRHLAGWTVTADLAAANVNGDEKTNATDATLLTRYLAGWTVNSLIGQEGIAEK